jgi:cell division protein YceG involved in septum cleavage
MNQNNIKYWEVDGTLFAEWGDRSLDDDERYDGIILTATYHRHPNDTDVSCMKRIRGLIAEVYDQWIRETRNGD